MDDQSLSQNTDSGSSYHKSLCIAWFLLVGFELIFGFSLLALFVEVFIGFLLFRKSKVAWWAATVLTLLKLVRSLKYLVFFSGKIDTEAGLTFFCFTAVLILLLLPKTRQFFFPLSSGVMRGLKYPSNLGLFIMIGVLVFLLLLPYFRFLLRHHGTEKKYIFRNIVQEISNPWWREDSKLCSPHLLYCIDKKENWIADVTLGNFFGETSQDMLLLSYFNHISPTRMKLESSLFAYSPANRFSKSFKTKELLESAYAFLDKIRQEFDIDFTIVSGPEERKVAGKQGVVTTVEFKAEDGDYKKRMDAIFFIKDGKAYPFLYHAPENFYEKHQSTAYEMIESISFFAPNDG